MNYRIRKNGGKIYLADDIHLSYYCRDSIKGISDMAKKNGMWNIITMKLCPGSMGLRHFIPFAFVVSIPLLLLLGLIHWSIWALLATELTLYTLLDIVFSIKLAESPKEFFTILAIFPIFHISYGIGSICGLFEIIKPKYNDKNYSPRKI